MSYKSEKTLFYDPSEDFKKLRASTPINFDDFLTANESDDENNDPEKELLFKDDDQDFDFFDHLSLNDAEQKCDKKQFDAALSDVSSDLDLSSEKLQEKAEVNNCENHPNEALSTIDEIIAEMPIDDPLLLSMKYSQPINQDPEAKVPKMNMAKEFSDLPIFIAEIFDPAHFWCHVAYQYDDIHYNFDVFHLKFNETYKALKKDDLRFSKENLKGKEGLIVAAYFSAFAHWYRVMITEYNVEKDVARVYCIDYGTKGYLKRSRLKYLFKEFMQYPEYCFRGRLFEVKPLNNSRYFKSTDTENFIAHVSSRSFFATLERYDEIEDAYEMSLIDTSDGIDVKDLVLFDNIATDIDSKEYDKNICLGPTCYLLPTFDMLEKGGYPRYVDIYEMEAKEANFHLAIDTNFFHAVTFSEIEKRKDLIATLKTDEFRRIHKYVYDENV